MTWLNPKFYPSSPADDRPQAPPEPSGRELARFVRRGGDGRPDTLLRLAIDEYQGRAYLSLRVFEADRDGRGWWPTKRGCSVRLSEAEGLARAIEAVAREHAEQGGPPPAEEPRYVERRRQRPARDWGSTELPAPARGSGDDFDEGGIRR